MSFLDKLKGWVGFAVDKIKSLRSKIDPAVRKAAEIAEFVAETIDEAGDAIAAVEPQDVPFLYGPLATAIVDAQAAGVVINALGGEKWAAAQASLRAAQEGIKIADEVFDRRWAAGQPFLEAFIARAKRLRQFGFEPSAPK